MSLSIKTLWESHPKQPTLLKSLNTLVLIIKNITSFLMIVMYSM